MMLCLRTADLLSFSAVILLSAPVFGQEPSADPIRLPPVIAPRASLRPLNEVKVPSAVPGIIAEMKTELGQTVKKGDVLAVIDNKLAEAEMRAKELIATNAAAIRIQAEKLKERTIQYEEELRLLKTAGSARRDVRLAEVGVRIAEEELANSEAEQKQAKAAFDASSVLNERHFVRSPIDGRVEKRNAVQGEAIEQNQPVFTVIQTDIIKVEGDLDNRYAGRVRPGMAIEVVPNVFTGPQLTLLGHTGKVLATRFVGPTVCVSGGEDGVIFVWDLEKARVRRVIRGHLGPILALTTVPGSPNKLISAGNDLTIRIWDLATGEQTRLIEIPRLVKSAHALVIDPKQPNFCYAGHGDRTIRVWDLTTSEQDGAALEGHTGTPSSLAITADGSTLLSIGDEEAVRVWDTKTRKSRDVLAGRSAGVRQFSLSPDSKRFLFNTQSNVEIRNVADGLTEDRVSAFDQRSHFDDVAVFTPDGKFVLVGNERNQLELWQLPSDGRPSRVVRTYDAHAELINAVDFSADGRYFASAGADRTVCVWRLPDPATIAAEQKTGVLKYVSSQVEGGNQARAYSAEVENRDGALTAGTSATVIIYPTTRPVANSVNAN